VLLAASKHTAVSSFEFKLISIDDALPRQARDKNGIKVEKDAAFSPSAGLGTPSGGGQSLGPAGTQKRDLFVSQAVVIA
jgi:hypothetical protein